MTGMAGDDDSDTSGGDADDATASELHRSAFGAADTLRRMIGPYHIRHQIDAGGMGIVYEAVQEQPRRAVALKIMRRGLTSRSARRRFEYESQLLARLSHPGIAVVYEAGTHREHGEEFPFFAMEYIAGARHLTDYAREHGLDTQQRLRLMAEACDAVHHAHLKGIIHRDLKPANVLVGSTGIPKIIDFGIARALDSDLAPVTQQTDVGQVIGTWQYMSPEQVSGDPRDLDARSDVYALGLILFELLTGASPYDLSGLSPSAAANVIRGPAAPLSRHADAVLRGDLRRVVLRAIEKERDRRYASADALARDLRRVLANEPVEARSPTVTYLVGSATRRQVSRHPWISVAMLTVVATAVAHLLAAPLVFRWVPQCAAAFESLGAKVLSVPASVPGIERLRLVALSDGTDFGALARGSGVEGVSNEEITSLRLMHGAFMKRMAESGARAVAWDIFFSSETRYDAAFRDGMSSLIDSGIPVVLGLETWKPDAAGAPSLSPVLAATPGALWGGCTLSVDPQVSLDAAVCRDLSMVTPSLALCVVAASRRPGSNVTFDVDTSNSAVRATWWSQHPLIASARVPNGPPEVWRLTAVQRAGDSKTQDPTDGIEAADFLALCTFPVPDERALDSVRLDYAEVWRASPAKWREWFEGRIVLIGDGRRARPFPDFRHLPDGREVWGGSVQASAVAALLTGRFATVPQPMWSLVMTATAACVGAVGAIACGRHALRTLALILIGSVAMVVIALWIYRDWLLLCNPSMPIFALVTAGWASAGVMRARTWLSD